MQTLTRIGVFIVMLALSFMEADAMCRSRFFTILVFLSLFTASRGYATDINDIVYPPPEPERMETNDRDQDQNNQVSTQDSEDQGKRPGITEEVHDRDKLDRIYVYPDGRVLVPGTTPFESVEDYERRQKNNPDGAEYHNHHHHHKHHHPKPDYQIEPQLSQKKGRVKSKLGITGPGYIFVPAKEGKR